MCTVPTESPGNNRTYMYGKELKEAFSCDDFLTAVGLCFHSNL